MSYKIDAFGHFAPQNYLSTIPDPPFKGFGMAQRKETPTPPPEPPPPQETGR
jgi:hypothetical protein